MTVIGETLQRITDPSIITPEKLRERIDKPPADFDELAAFASASHGRLR